MAMATPQVMLPIIDPQVVCHILCISSSHLKSFTYLVYGLIPEKSFCRLHVHLSTSTTAFCTNLLIKCTGFTRRGAY